MENNLVGAKSRGFMVGMGPHSFPSITILISFNRRGQWKPTSSLSDTRDKFTGTIPHTVGTAIHLAYTANALGQAEFM